MRSFEIVKVVVKCMGYFLKKNFLTKLTKIPKSGYTGSRYNIFSFNFVSKERNLEKGVG